MENPNLDNIVLALLFASDEPLSARKIAALIEDVTTADVKQALDDAKADFGFGAYMDIGYFLMSFQFAWPTDLYRVDQNMKFHFAIGPTF
jgi:chromosome segregation and condensation protein ScpB